LDLVSGLGAGTVDVTITKALEIIALSGGKLRHIRPQQS
jgi:hypothetical protein